MKKKPITYLQTSQNRKICCKIGKKNCDEKQQSWSEANVSGTLTFGSSVKTVRTKNQHIPKINVPESVSIRVVGSGEQGMKKKFSY